MSEQIKKLSVGLNEESLNLCLGLKKDNSYLEELINITKSPYYYTIGHKIIQNNKIIISRVLSNDNYNSKNFDSNFNYYINKFNFLKAQN